MVTCKPKAKMPPPEIRFKMPNWYYDKQALRETPSFLDGIPNVKEMRYRREGARFIMKVGTKLGLKCETTASGIVYFHRFYMFHSFKQFPRFITSCCCLFLAGKVEETPKKCKQIISTASEFLTQKQLETFGDDPKEEVMTLERILLKTIKFDLQVAHPYHFILRYAKAIHGDRDTIEQMVQMAWTFINDSLQSTLCLQWEPEIIAIAAIYLASKLSSFEISDWQGRTSSQRRWWEAFASEVSVELLEDICHQILDLYSTTNPDTPQDSPPDEEEVCPTPPRRTPQQRPPSPPMPLPKKEKKEEPHTPQETKSKLSMPPMPPLGMVHTSVSIVQ
ncbi:cyclin-K-like [Tropilaelaps mercedesae]|uniref:Cyclin-K-like n=1 Tax=Tropilaelaps mercedesae TaxID=418985 RepID=A0A1V9X2D5_9ACAR|nr:cyclin-K-like [Tropilaelaps mercedesae]